MAKQYKTGLIITGDASGGIKAMQATEAQLKQLNQGFDSGSRKARKFAADTNDTSRELDFLKSAAMGVGAALAGAFAVGNLRGQAQMIAQTDALAKSLQVSTTTLQQWQYAGQQVGIEADKMGDIFKDVSDKIGDFIATGGGEAADLFENLNLNIQELRRLQPDQQLLKIGEALNQLEDPSQKIFYLESIADDASRLLPLLENGGAALRQYAQEASALGVAMSEIDIEAARDADRAMLRIGASVEGLTNQLIVELAPAIVQTSDVVQDLVKNADDLTEPFREFGTQSSLVAQTVIESFSTADQYITETYNGWAGDGRDTAQFIGDAFRNLPANIKAMVELGTVELLVLVDKAQAYGEAIDKYLNPANWFNGSFDVIGQNLEKQLALVDQVRTESIADILAERQEILGAFEIEQDADRQAAAIQALEANALAFVKAMNQANQQNTRSTTTSKEAQKAAQQQAAAWQALRHEMDPLAAAHDKYVERLETINGMLGKGEFKGNMAAYNSAIQWAAQEYVDAATGAEEYEKQLQSLVSQFDNQYQKAQQLEQALANINAAYRNGDISGAQYRRMVANVRDEMRELAQESQPLSEAMSRAWTEAANRIDATFADAFKGAFDSFDSFSDQLRNGLKTLLAELAYQATLQPIVIGVTADAQRAMGMMPSSKASLSSGMTQVGNNWGTLANMGSKAWDYGSSMLGINSAIGGTTAAGYSAATFAGSATGAYGGWAGSAAAGAAASGGALSGAMSAIGTAMPYVGAVLAIDSLLGGPISGAIGGLFGSDRKSYGQIGSFAGMPDGDDVYGEDGRYPGMLQRSALGYVGVTAKQKTDDDALVDMVSSFVEVDNSLAAVMTAAQLEKTQTKLDGWESSKTKNIGNIVDERLAAVVDATDTVFADALSGLSGESLVAALVSGLQVENLGAGMATAIAEDMNAEFRKALSSGSNVETATQAILSSAQAVQLLGDSVDRLNLQFNATTTGALNAAGSIAELVGGVQSLSSLQSQYYDTFYTETEKFAYLQSDLAEQFQAMGRTLPETRKEMRSMVEGLNLMTEAGQEQYATILQLVPSLEQYIGALNSVDTERWSLQNELLTLQGKDMEVLNRQRQAELDKLDPSNRALQERIWALQDEQDAVEAATTAQRQAYQNALLNNGNVLAIDNALDAYNTQIGLIDEMAQARQEQLKAEMQAVDTLSGLYDSLVLSNQSILNPLERLGEAQRQFAELQVRAENGDTDAVSQLQGASSSYLDAAASYYGQGSTQYAAIFGEVTGAVGDLESQFGDSVATLGTIESIQEQALREQQQAHGVLLDQLYAQVDMYGELGSIADLLSYLPEQLASSLAGVLGSGMTGAGSGPGGSITQKDISDAVSGVSGDNFISDSEAMDLYSAALRNGVSLSEVNKYLPAGSQSAEEWAASKGLPSFDTGAWQLDRDQLAMVHKDEMIVPSRGGIADEFRSYATGNGNAELVQRMDNLIRSNEALRAEVAQLRAERSQDARSQLREQQGIRKNTKLKAPTL